MRYPRGSRGVPCGYMYPLASPTHIRVCVPATDQLAFVPEPEKRPEQSMWVYFRTLVDLAWREAGRFGDGASESNC